jgi:hypothetical protein
VSEPTPTGCVGEQADTQPGRAPSALVRVEGAPGERTEHEALPLGIELGAHDRDDARNLPRTITNAYRPAA